MNRNLICISCPQGCRLNAGYNAETGECTVTGNRCPRGAAYAKQELTDPRRVVTAVMKTDCAALPFLPVRTDKPFPRAKIPALLNRLYAMTVRTPVSCGDTVIEDVDNTGIRVIVTGSCQ